jgi:hypothetical protein
MGKFKNVSIVIAVLVTIIGIFILGGSYKKYVAEKYIDLGPLYKDLMCDCRIYYRGDSAIYIDRRGYIKLIRYSSYSKKFE